MSVRDRLEAIEADITTLALDAIVNAANEALLRGGGVDGAIRRKAGPEVEKELRRIGRCPAGEAVVTAGGALPAKYIIHTVAPIFDDTAHAEKRKLLQACYRNALARADENGIRTLAFPCIGTGIYGWPADSAAEIAFRAVATHLAGCDMQQRIVFCCFSPADRARYARLIAAS
jgi:O-acetyl-ADP-ribose deacetylase (regulator of RNase III)